MYKHNAETHPSPRRLSPSDVATASCRCIKTYRGLIKIYNSMYCHKKYTIGWEANATF